MINKYNISDNLAKLIDLHIAKAVEAGDLLPRTTRVSRMDFTTAKLNRLDLRNLSGMNATFAFAEMMHSNLNNAAINYSDFNHAYLDYAILEHADLGHSDFTYAHCIGTNFNNAFLLKCDFSDANLQGANLQRANLQECNLHSTDFEGADLQGADLQDAQLESADFTDADLRGATVSYPIGMSASNYELACKIPNAQHGCILIAGCWRGTVAQFVERVASEKIGMPRLQYYARALSFAAYMTAEEVDLLISAIANARDAVEPVDFYGGQA